ncbi:hypothetical protein [Roseibium algae]|uniref:Uncharacterized protein n=1 Tax=Roseibium algae TaxID=3123038 RepID=A0ABU8TG35_9HYPH
MEWSQSDRVLNRVSAQIGKVIALDPATGLVSLHASTYRISGVSVITYFDQTLDTDGRVSTRSRPNASYAIR